MDLFDDLLSPSDATQETIAPGAVLLQASVAWSAANVGSATVWGMAT